MVSYVQADVWLWANETETSATLRTMWLSDLHAFQHISIELVMCGNQEIDFDPRQKTTTRQVFG